jgi:hypothetical protein
MKRSRKVEKGILVAAGLAAIVGIALWMDVDGALSRRPTAVGRAPKTTASAGAATRATLAQTETIAQPRASAPTSAAIPPSPTPVPAMPTPPPPIPPPKRADPEAGPSEPAQPAATAESASTAEPEEPGTAPAAEAPPAGNLAVDLFAERIAKIEQVEGGDPNDASDAGELNRFKARPNDDESSPAIAQALRDHLSEWLAAFPPERANRLHLVSVECRTGACQILIAELSIDGSVPLVDLDDSSFHALAGQEWWKQAGLAFSKLSKEVVADHAQEPGQHVLWTMYLTRAVTG